MNAKGDANRSVRATKQKLYHAMIRLLQEKDVRDITVRELTSLAHVSRGTFYFHYTDIYSLMQQMEQAQLERLSSLPEALMPADAASDEVPPALVSLFVYLNENLDVCRALYGKSCESEFSIRARRLLVERCLGFLSPEGGTEEQEILLTFAVSGSFGSIAAWQRLEPKPSPEDMAALLWRSIRAIKELL